MSRNFLYALFGWNIIITIALAWLFWSKGEQSRDRTAAEPTGGPARVVDSSTDTAHGDLRLAYFRMDSVIAGYNMVKEKSEKFKQEGQRLETKLGAEARRAQARYDELMGKDRTYTTQAENEADQAEIERLAANIQGMQAQSQENLARLEATMLQEIQTELMGYLEEYNKGRGFTYILSIQNGGQIMVGQGATDITTNVVDGLNGQYAKEEPTTP
jgi:outer membrane protein